MKELTATLIVGPKNDYVDASKLRRILGRDEIFWLVGELRNKIKYASKLLGSWSNSSLKSQAKLNL